LQRLLGVFAQFFLDRRLHRIAMLDGLHLDDLDLFHRGGDVAQPVKVRFGHARADDDQKGKALVFLRRDRRQGEGFKVIEAQVHALGLIQVSLAVFDGIVHAFEPAQGGVGKPAKSDDTHGGCLLIKGCPSWWQMHAAQTRPKTGVAVPTPQYVPGLADKKWPLYLPFAAMLTQPKKPV